MDRVPKQSNESDRARRMAQGKFTSRSQEGAMAMRVNASPLMTAQRNSLNGLLGGAAQRKEAADAAAAQRVEEEEPLQGRFEALQRVEEEEPLQGKFGTAQRVEEEEPLQGKFESVQRVEEEEPLQGKFESAATAQLKETPLAKPNQTGLPDNLKHGVEALSGISLDGVKVHYNSSQPAQLNALAYAQGRDIHVAPGQEKHLPHEAWHVAQQAQGRVRPTRQMKEGVPVNDDAGLENEADVMGAKAMQMRFAGDAASAQAGGASAQGTVQREDEPDWDNIPTRGRSNAVMESPQPQAPLPPDSASATSSASATATPEAQAPLPLDAPSSAHLGEGEASGASEEEHAKHLEEREKLETVVENVEAAKEIGDGTSELAENIDKLQNAPKVESNSTGIFDKVKGAWEKFKESTVGKAFDLVSPVINAAKAILGMKEKWHIWSVFDNTAAVTGSDGKKTIKADAPPEAAYGLKKAPAGFVRHVKEFFMSIFELTTKILAFIPGAQIAAAGMAVFSSIVSICDAMFSVCKGIYQRIFGEKKDSNSASLLDKALAGNTPSLELIFNLKLSSIEGSSIAGVNWIKEKLNNVSLSNIGAAEDLKSKRIIDEKNAETGERIGPPKTKEELFVRLTKICKNPSSKELIRNEIKEAMTGYGR
ncbi:MAG TPA: DUF4157 domain-containing protein [Rhodocyclaceae bacterium]